MQTPPLQPREDPVELIEVQSGEYLGEDDIVRFQDRYGRSNKIEILQQEINN